MSVRETEVPRITRVAHAVVGRLLTYYDPVHKITIIPRGLRVASTRFLATGGSVVPDRSYFRDAVVATLDGHAAETLVFGEMRTGSAMSRPRHRNRAAHGYLIRYQRTPRAGRP